MGVALRKHPTEPRVYLHPETGSVLVSHPTYVAAWDSSESWLDGESPDWSTPTLRAARQVLAEKLATPEEEPEPREIEVGDTVDVADTADGFYGPSKGWEGAQVLGLYVSNGKQMATVTQPGFAGIRQVRFERLEK